MSKDAAGTADDGTARPAEDGDGADADGDGGGIGANDVEYAESDDDDADSVSSLDTDADSGAEGEVDIVESSGDRGSDRATHASEYAPVDDSLSAWTAGDAGSAEADNADDKAPLDPGVADELAFESASGIASSTPPAADRGPLGALLAGPAVPGETATGKAAAAVDVEAAQPSEALDVMVGNVLAWLGVDRPAGAADFPALPLGGLAQSLLVAAQAQQGSKAQRPVERPATPGLQLGDITSALDLVDAQGRVVTVTAAVSGLGPDADPDEAQQEAAAAEFNLTLGWVPVLGTVYNALNLVGDVLQLSSAVLGGDMADVIDEVGDIAVDVIGLVPIVGGPLAAGVHYLLAGPPAPVNQVPNAVVDSFTMNEDTTLTGNVLANDTDPDGDPLTAAVNTLPGHGTVTVNANGSFTYKPTANYYGNDTFSYTASDGMSSSVGVVNIKINNVAEPQPPSSPFTRPVSGYRVTQEYGNGHTGIDLAVGAGTQVVAAANGVIYFEGWGTTGNNGARSNWMGSSAGISVLVQHDSLGIMTGYAHLSRTIVDQGQRVSKGQVIGYVGCTGACTGPHLHFEVLPMPLNSRNGIYGRVNPRNYMSL